MKHAPKGKPKNRMPSDEFWPKDFKDRAMKEGWDLFMASTCTEGDVLQIHRIDDPESVAEQLGVKALSHTFENDGEAYEHVARRASLGSVMHLLALYLDGRPASHDLYLPRVLSGEKGKWVTIA